MKEQILNELKNLDYSSIGAEYILHNLADIAIPKLKKIVSSLKNGHLEKKPILVSSENEIINQVLHNIKISRNWCDEVSFRDAKNAKKITEIFVPLDFYLTPKRVHLDIGNEERIPLDKVLKFEENNFIILGGPGAGKTTLMKYVSKQLFENNDHFKKRFCCPFVIRLRDINSQVHSKLEIPESLYFILIEQLGIQIKYPIDLDDKENKELQFKEYYSIIKRVVSNFIDDMGILLILDGFDEIPNVELKKIIAKEIRELSLGFNNSNFILTSRTGEFDFDIEKATTYEICPLTDFQIKDFINKWLKDSKKSEDLYNQIKASPFNDTVIRPLNIAHLCAIFERYNKIPERPKSVYRKIIYLMLEEWDSQRSIERISNYANFPSDRKFEFLSKLSFVLTTNYHKSIFTKNDLELGYRKIYSDFELPIGQVKNVIDEIESHSGLFIQSGFNTFEFSHKSIQEYLSAEYIAKSPLISYDSKTIIEAPSEFAIATAISTNPNLFFASIVLSILNAGALDNSFIEPFINRLLIEKPDFNRDPSLACAIAYLYTLLNNEPTNFKYVLRLQKPKRRDLKQKEYERIMIFNQKSESIYSKLNLLINHHVNISRSFLELHNHYTQGSENLLYLSNNKINSNNIPKDMIFEIRKTRPILGLANMPDSLLLDSKMICLFNNLS